MNHILGILILLLFIGCTTEVDKEYFKAPLAQRDIKWSSIYLDTILLEKTSSSYVGETQIRENTIYFVDSKFCKMFLFDTAGRFTESVLKSGRGPKEINTGEIAATLFTGNQQIFFGVSYDIHAFSKDWEDQRSMTLDWQIKHSREEMLKNPRADMHGMYAPAYEKFILRERNGFLYFPIYSQHPEFNFVSSRYYYDQSRSIARASIHNGKVLEVIGRRSPIYKNYEFIGHLSLLNFDIDKNGNFYLCFEPDSVIYQYDSAFNITHAYGFEGRNMDKNYTENKCLEDFYKVIDTERAEKGYYTWIRFIDELGMLFRSYQKGVNETTDGLQIYKDGVLLADVDVPKGFKVNDYIPPFVYSSIVVDEFAEEMKIYRFAIE